MFKADLVLTTQTKDLIVAFAEPVVAKVSLLSFKAWSINLQSVEDQTSSNLIWPATFFALELAFFLQQPISWLNSPLKFQFYLSEFPELINQLVVVLVQLKLQLRRLLAFFVTADAIAFI